MSSEAHSGSAWSAGLATRWRRSRWRLRWRKVSRLVAANFSSSLTRRIVSLNLGGLLALVIGVLWLNHFRADIIEARTQSLTTQAGIIAAAISASATADN
jgi:two-component system, OmpR family, sensor histidine kinase ChvG